MGRSRHFPDMTKDSAVIGLESDNEWIFHINSSLSFLACMRRLLAVRISLDGARSLTPHLVRASSGEHSRI